MYQQTSGIILTVQNTIEILLKELSTQSSRSLNFVVTIFNTYSHGVVTDFLYRQSPSHVHLFL